MIRCMLQHRSQNTRHVNEADINDLDEEGETLGIILVPMQGLLASEIAVEIGASIDSIRDNSMCFCTLIMGGCVPKHSKF